MKNWRTTVPALVAAGAGFVLFSPQYFAPWLIDLSKYVMLGGLACFGIAAKDATVHDTQGQVNAATAKENEKVLEKANGV